jgi:hypothetical protein
MSTFCEGQFPLGVAKVELNDQGQSLLWRVMRPGAMFERSQSFQDALADAYAIGLTGAELDALTIRIDSVLVTRFD